MVGLVICFGVLLFVEIMVCWWYIWKQLKRLDVQLYNIEVAMDDVSGVTSLAVQSARYDLEKYIDNKLLVIEENENEVLDRLDRLKYKKYIEVPKEEKIEIELKGEG